MADTLFFELVSPDRLLMSAEVEAVMVPGSQGDFTIMPGHQPIISTLRPSTLDVYAVWGGKPSARIFVRGGFVDAALGRVTVLAEEAIDLAALDRAELATRVANALEDTTLAKTDAERMRAQQVYEGLNQLLSAVE